MSTFLDKLRRRADDRGIMANLRCVLVDGKRHRAWPALNRIGVSVTDEVDSLVAGLFATYPEETQAGNFGSTCRAIEAARREDRSDGSKLTPTERRFQHILAAEKGEELHQRVTRMIRIAKAQGVRINFKQLGTDLRRWNEQTKTEWAAAFWTQGEASSAEEGV
jgi:CRISPR system Cascade subunit CasB